MLGRRDPQRSLFKAQAWPHRVPEDSFYARMGAVNDVLFKDDDLAKLYCDDNGRRSRPPSLMSGVLLLQFYDDVSDQEAIARMSFDLRWKVALNLPLDFDPPHSSSLSVFRGRLVAGGQERYAFNRLIRVGREGAEGVFHQLCLFFVLKGFAAQHPLRGGAPRGETRADALQQQCLHKPGRLGALLQGCRERLGRQVARKERLHAVAHTGRVC